MTLEHLSPDATAVEQILDEWRTAEDVHKTMRLRGKEWTPPRIAAAFEEVIAAGRVEVTGEPPRYRNLKVTPGEVQPRRGPGLDA